MLEVWGWAAGTEWWRWEMGLTPIIRELLYWACPQIVSSEVWVLRRQTHELLYWACPQILGTPIDLWITLLSLSTDCFERGLSGIVEILEANADYPWITLLSLSTGCFQRVCAVWDIVELLEANADYPWITLPIEPVHRLFPADLCGMDVGHESVRRKL